MRLRTKYTQRLPTAPGLRLDVPMFEGSGTKVLDVSGKGNHGTITDAVWTRDENGVAMSFNGTSAYIDCGNDASLNITDAFTAEVVVKPADLTNGQLISRETGNTWNDQRLAMIYYYDTLVGTLSNGTAGQHDLEWGSWTVNTWYHIVMTLDGTDWIAYKDGKQVDSVSQTITPDLTGTVLKIGKGRGFFPNQFNGTISSVRIYAVALTADQIKRRYEQTKRDYVRGS